MVCVFFGYQNILRLICKVVTPILVEKNKQQCIKLYDSKLFLFSSKFLFHKLKKPLGCLKIFNV